MEAERTERGGFEPPITRGDIRFQVGQGYAISEDGKFGKSTEAIVKKFQSDAGIPADGVVGAGTWKALNVVG